MFGGATVPNWPLLPPNRDLLPTVEPPALESIVTVDPKLGSVFIPKLVPVPDEPEAKAGGASFLSPETEPKGEAALPCLAAKLEKGEAALVLPPNAVAGFGVVVAVVDAGVLPQRDLPAAAKAPPPPIGELDPNAGLPNAGWPNAGWPKAEPPAWGLLVFAAAAHGDLFMPRALVPPNAEGPDEDPKVDEPNDG